MRKCTLILAIFPVLTTARAATITVTSTLTQAAAINCFSSGPYFATCSESHAYGSATSVADAAAGHLGMFVGASAPGYVNGFAQFIVGLAFSDVADSDVMEIDFSLQGSFSNGGATASLYVDDGDSLTTTAISCGTGIQQLYGTDCTPGNRSQQVVIPLANLDNLTLTFLLQPSLSYAPAFADFLHSMDFTIQVPEGATIVNNPGGSLFQTPGAPAPEPAPALTIGACLIAIAPWRRILLMSGKRG